MSKEVVDKFMGRTYKSHGKDPGNPAHLSEYFPDVGVTMSIKRCDVLDVKKKYLFSYGKVVVSDSPAQTAIQSAVYRVVGDTLVATDIELRPGQEGSGPGALIMKETLSANGVDAHGKAVEIVHTLEFSDGSRGVWTCK